MVMVIGADGKIDRRVSSSPQYTGDRWITQNIGWTVYHADPNAFVRYTYGELANRAATLYHSSAIARACVHKPLAYVLGSGLVFRSAIDEDFLGLSKEDAKKWSKRFSQLLHAEKLEVDWYQKSARLYTDASITGDALVYLLREDEDDKPFDLIVAGGHDIDDKYQSEGCVLGVKIDKFNRLLGFRNQAEKDVELVDSAGNINAILYRGATRAGQVRGLSKYYSEIGRSRAFDRIWDATVERMVQEAVQVGYYNVTSSDPERQAMAAARAAAGRKKEGVNEIKKMGGSIAMSPGMYVFGNEEGLQFTDLKTPSNNFASANEWMLNMFAMATGYSPEFLMSKYSTSYTAHKGALNDVWRRITMERDGFVRQVEDPINMEYLKHFIRTGQLEVPVEFWADYRIRRAYAAGTYIGPALGAINPLQEVRADIEAVTNGGMTLEAFAAKRGIDFWPTLDEMQAQFAAWYKDDEESPPESEKKEPAKSLRSRIFGRRNEKN